MIILIMYWSTFRSIQQRGISKDEKLRINSWERQEIFLFSEATRPTLGLSQPPIPLGTGGHVPRYKLAGE
jgi:hypothetical protein